MRTLPMLCLLILGGCDAAAEPSDVHVVAPSGSGNQRSYAASGFDHVSLAGPDNATVSVGPAFSVRAVGDSKVLDRLVVEARDGRLLLRRKRGLPGGSGTARFLVSLPALRGAEVAGSGGMAVDHARADTFDASVAGSGDLRIGHVAARRLETSIAGSGDLHAGGTADALKVSIAGSGGLDAPGLTARRATISIAGSGGVRARVRGPATVSIMGSGSALLGAEARCSVSKMGSGSARCG